MRAALVALCLAGCRLHFDDVVADARQDPDVPTGHDEDGDGVPDELDTCPHLAAPQDDGDGDGVGDACDPEPALGRQQLALFDPLVTGAGWTVISATWTETGDAFRYDANVFGELRRPFAMQHGVVEIGVNILARTGGSQHQVSLSVHDSVMSPYHYVEVYEPNNGAGYAAVSEHEGASVYTPVAVTNIANGLQTGPLVVRFTIAPLQPTLSIFASWPGEPYTAMLDVPGYAGGANIGIGTQGVMLELEYLVVITTR